MRFTRTKLSQTPRRPVAKIIHKGAWILCVALTLQFVFKTDSAQQVVCGLLIVIAGFVLAIAKPLYALYLMPVVALLGPIVRWQISQGLSLNLGDLFFLALLAGYVLGGDIGRKLWLGPHVQVMTLIGVLIVLSALLSLDLTTSAISLLGIAELLIAYFMTINLVRTSAEILNTLVANVIGVALCSLLVTITFVRGDTLLLDMPEFIARNFTSLRLARPELFAAATFFVTSFIFPLTISIVIGVVLLLRSSLLHRTPRILLVVSLALNASSMILLNNKTGIYSMALVFAGVFLTRRFSERFASRGWYMFCALAFIGGLVFVFTTYVNEDLQGGLVKRLNSRLTDNLSFEHRLPVWGNVLTRISGSARVMLIGLGPDVTIRNPDRDEVRSIFTSEYGTEGAVDNGYLYILINYGVLVLGLFLLLVRSVLRGLWRVRKRNWDVRLQIGNYAIRCGIICWGIMSVTQQGGVSKPMLMFVQLIALSDVLMGLHRRQAAVAARQGWRPGRGAIPEPALIAPFAHQ